MNLNANITHPLFWTLLFLMTNLSRGHPTGPSHTKFSKNIEPYALTSRVCEMSHAIQEVLKDLQMSKFNNVNL